jgi:hypothetical protein
MVTQFKVFCIGAPSTPRAYAVLFFEGDQCGGAPNLIRSRRGKQWLRLDGRSVECWQRISAFERVIRSGRYKAETPAANSLDATTAELRETPTSRTGPCRPPQVPGAGFHL